MDYPGEKLLLRLWETIAEKGIGAVLTPWQIRRAGRARIDIRREEMLALAQTERDVEDIRSGRTDVLADGRLLGLPESATPPAVHGGECRSEGHRLRSILTRIERNALADALRREVNVGKAVLSAEAELELDPQEPSEKRADDDWLLRWRDSASAVSSQELQDLWGRVLAGEIKAPGAFSLRTLEFLKNLSRDEALQIARLSRFVVDNWIFKRNVALLESEGVTFGYLLEMQELGIVSGVGTIGLNVTIDSILPDRFERVLMSHNRGLVVSHEDGSKAIVLDVYQLTSVGRQIVRLGTFEPHEPYLRSVGRAILGQGFKVKIARWQQVTETEGRYSEAEELDV